MKNSLSILFILLTLLKCFGQSDRWQPLISKEILFDTETLQKTPSLISVWIKYLDKDGGSTKNLTEIDCVTAKIRTTNYVSYDKNGNVSSQSTKPSQWENLIPETNGESYHKIFCKGELTYQELLDWKRKNDLIEKGSELMKLKDYDKAISVYNQLLKEFPSFSAFATFRMGNANNEQGKTQVAISLIIKAIALEPDPFYYKTLADIYRKSGQLKLATDTYWKGLYLDKDKYSGVSELAKIYSDNKDQKNLVRLYKYQISNKHFIYYSTLARFYQNNGEINLFNSTINEGVKILSLKIESESATINDYDSLASLYEIKKDLNKAENILLKCLEVFPTTREAYTNLGMYYAKIGLHDKAISILKAGLPYVKYSFETRLILVLLKKSYQATGQTKEIELIEIELKNLADK